MMLKESFFFPHTNVGTSSATSFLEPMSKKTSWTLLSLFLGLPRPQQSWFDIHYFDPTIPGDYFRRQLRLNRNTFLVLLNILRLRLRRQNTRLRDCDTGKTFGTGNVSLGAWKFLHNDRPKFNVGKSTVIEAAQDVVEALCNLKMSTSSFLCQIEKFWPLEKLLMI